MDGLDGIACFWANKRVVRSTFSTRQRGEGEVMVWAGISWVVKTLVEFVEGNLNAVAYTNILSNLLEPFLVDHYPNGFIFQQNGAPVHTAVHTRQYFMDAGIVTMDWVPRSPDMNYIENCWGLRTRALCSGGQQCDTIEDLKEGLTMKWENISVKAILDLLSSNPRRVRELYNKRGCTMKY